MADKPKGLCVQIGAFGGFEGEFLDGRRHGRGVLRTAEGKEGGGVYEGEWAGGLRHGKGRLCGGGGLSYEGEWRDDSPHGEGVEVREGGEYRGEFSKGLRHGGGCLKCRCGTVKGFWEGGGLTFGLFAFSNGARFEGGVGSGEAKGMGKYVFDGGTYEGQLTNGAADGHGTLALEGVGRYGGDWRGGVFEGRGVFELAALRRKFEGGWVNGRISGGGCFSDERIGFKLTAAEFVSARPQGKAELHFGEDCGISFLGNLSHGLPDGPGQWRWQADGINYLYIGAFSNGAANGQGALRDGAWAYEGAFLGGLPHGCFIFFKFSFNEFR
jgi:hypothetical protein